MADEQIPKDMVVFWKQSWEAYQKAAEAMQEQGEKMMEMMLSANPVMTDEAKKSTREWAENAKRMQKNYLDMVNENLRKMEEAWKGK